MSCAAIAWWAIMTLLYHTVHTTTNCEKKNCTIRSSTLLTLYCFHERHTVVCNNVMYTCHSCRSDTAVRSSVNDNPISLSSYMPDDSFMTTDKSSLVLNIQDIWDSALYYWVTTDTVNSTVLLGKWLLTLWTALYYWVSGSWHCEQQCITGWHLTLWTALYY
jgi:hypothetical protein